jgi:pyruvate,water dikinase
MMKPEYILPLADTRATLALAGGKGASLARLSNVGLPVPGGFHVTTLAYQQFVAANNLQPDILAALEAANASDPATLETASRAIYDLFAQALCQDIVDAISYAYAAPGNLQSRIPNPPSPCAPRPLPKTCLISPSRASKKRS